MEEGRVLAAAESLYAAVATPQAWPAAIAAIVGLVRGGHGFLQEEGTAGVFASHAGVDERDMARLCTPEALRMYEPFFRLIPPGLSTRTGLISDRDFARSPCYNEVVRPIGGFHSLHLHRTKPDSFFVLSICRPQRAADFAPDEAARLVAVEPHVATALALRRRLGRAERWSEGLVRALDRLGTGVILLDQYARPVFLNARAERVMAEGDGLSWDAAGFVGATPAATRHLNEAIFAFGAGPGHGRSRPETEIATPCAGEERRLRLQRPSGRPPLLVSVLPVGGLGLALAGLSAPQVAVFIAEPDAVGAIDRLAVAYAFRLTQRESDVAALLAMGFDPQGIATELGIGLATVRFHLKHVLDKTRTHSQARLVALLRGFVAGVDPWDGGEGNGAGKAGPRG